MTPIHIIGQPGAGKTTLIVDLVRAIRAEKFNVGTIKHSAHAHELDKRGMRDGREPGAENGRPLEPLGDHFWRIGDDYLR